MSNMEWAKKRKILYATVFSLVIILLAIYPVYQVTHPAPTCFDSKQNGTETGVDCGGPCSASCLVDIKPLNVVWTKAFFLSASSYDLGAYVENPNQNSGVKNARYNFRVLDNSGRVLTQKQGTTEIAPGSGMVIFEPHVNVVGNPDRVEIIFNQDDLAHWTRGKSGASAITSKNQKLINVDTTPRFDVTLVNNDSVDSADNLTVSAIVYDALRHPVALSRTSVDTVTAGGTQDTFFTWPTRFSKHTGGGVCTTPVDTMLVFDRSGSMSVNQKLISAKAAAEAYVDVASQDDKIGLVSFGTTATNPIDQPLSIDHDAVKNSIEKIQVEKGTLQYTDLGEALRAAVVELQSGNYTKGAKMVVVALTDGIANRPLDPANPKNKTYPEEYAAQVARVAQSSGMEVYAIGLGSDINEAFLAGRIATDQSHYFKAPTAAYLADAYKRISETVCKEEGFITDIVVTPRAIFAE